MNETLEFTNLCMVRDGDRVLVLDREKESRQGMTLPGGPVTNVESFMEPTHFLTSLRMSCYI